MQNTNTILMLSIFENMFHFVFDGQYENDTVGSHDKYKISVRSVIYFGNRKDKIYL